MAKKSFCTFALEFCRSVDQKYKCSKSHHLVIAKKDMQEEIYRKSSHSCLCRADTSHPSRLSRVGCWLAPDRIADGVLQ